MPIFSNYSASSPARKARLNRALLTRAETSRTSQRVRRSKSFEWSTQASFSNIDSARQGAISAAIAELEKKHPDRKLNVLDWGCGDGTAAKEVAQNKKLNVFGFSIDSSKHWIDSKGVTFFQTAVGALPVFLKKKRIKLDVVFAEASLKHMPIDYQIQHLCELLPSLNTGARVFPDFFYIEPNQKRSLEMSGYRVETKGNFLFALTKVK